MISKIIIIQETKDDEWKLHDGADDDGDEKMSKVKIISEKQDDDYKIYGGAENDGD